VAITYVENADAAHEVTSEIIDLGGSAFALHADVSNEAQVELLFREVDELSARSADS
jgi:NAD(P)-dependent dehydrogenase (short-subunit alcohol dehydrogenase family)